MGEVNKGWLYFGGRTSKLVAEELGNRVVPVDYVEDYLESKRNKGSLEVCGAIVTDMALQTITNWFEIEQLARELTHCRVVVVTERKQPGGLNLPVNVAVKTVDVVRMTDVEGILTGGGF